MDVRFSPQAQTDLQALVDYTLAEFGAGQARWLQLRFEASLGALARAPFAGSHRPDIDPAGRRFRYLTVMRRFVVVYEVAVDGVRVARILHGARDLVDEIDRDPGDDAVREVPSRIGDAHSQISVLGRGLPRSPPSHSPTPESSPRPTSAPSI